MNFPGNNLIFLNLNLMRDIFLETMESSKEGKMGNLVFFYAEIPELSF
jgi:hypothetical protein